MNIPPSLLRLLACLGLLSGTGKAAVTFSELRITPTSFSVTISGTLPDMAPKNHRATLYFVNPDPAANPGYALNDFQGAEIRSFLGTQSLLPDYPLGTGGIYWGDYAVVNFSQDLSTGETLNGTLSGTWSRPAFDVTRISSLNIFWGDDSSLNLAEEITGGVLLGSNVPVTGSTAPEPGSTLCVGFGGLLLLSRRFRRGR